jgi:hypothetical protein
MERGLRAVRRRIAAGRLPREHCLIIWYRPGRGEPCAVCDRRILGTETGLHCDDPEGGTVHFHSRCYGVWYRAVKGGPAGDGDAP